MQRTKLTSSFGIITGSVLSEPLQQQLHECEVKAQLQGHAHLRKGTGSHPRGRSYKISTFRHNTTNKRLHDQSVIATQQNAQPSHMHSAGVTMSSVPIFVTGMIVQPCLTAARANPKCSFHMSSYFWSVVLLNVSRAPPGYTNTLAPTPPNAGVDQTIHAVCSTHSQ